MAERLISVPAAKAHIEAAVGDQILKGCMNNVLDAIPAVDAVPVIRCKDCLWARPKDHREPTNTPRELICQCFKHHHIPAPWGARTAVCPDDFCSYGERREQNGICGGGI